MTTAATRRSRATDDSTATRNGRQKVAGRYNRVRGRSNRVPSITGLQAGLTGRRRNGSGGFGFEVARLGFDLCIVLGCPGVLYICFGTNPSLVQLGNPRARPKRTPFGSEPTIPGHTGPGPGYTGCSASPAPFPLFGHLRTSFPL